MEPDDEKTGKEVVASASKALVARSPSLVSRGLKDLGRVREIPVCDIHLDPTRFHFRTSPPQELEGADLNSVISVYWDPNDKKICVVNGHHRVSRGKELLRTHNFKAVEIEADSPEEARLTGALQNICEGNVSDEDTERMISEIEKQPAEVQRRIMAETDKYLGANRRLTP